MLREKRILSLLAVVICLFYLMVPAFAYAGNPYHNSHGQGYSEYEAGSRPPNGNTGTNTQTPSNGGYYNGSGGGNNGGISGNGSGTQYNGNGSSSGSGTGNHYNGNGTGAGSGSHSGSQSGSGARNPNSSGGTSGGSTGNHGGVNSADEHFNASLGSDGSISLSLSGAEGVTAGDPSSAIKLLFQKYKTIAVVITGVCVITAILSLLIQITKLGVAGDNERMRAIALKGIIFSGSALAIFGSLALVVGFFWNAFAS